MKFASTLMVLAAGSSVFAGLCSGQSKCYTLVNATNHDVSVSYQANVPLGPGAVTGQTLPQGHKERYCTPYRVVAAITTPDTLWEGNRAMVMGPVSDALPEGSYRMVTPPHEVKRQDEKRHDHPAEFPRAEGVEITIKGGVSTQNRFLSVADNGEKADLYIVNDHFGRQQWIIRPSADGRWCNILIAGGVKNDRKYLSASIDGTVVDLWREDDGSGRQRWVVENAPDGTALFRILGGVTGDLKYLSTTEDGSKVDLWASDDGKGRQRWLIHRW